MRILICIITLTGIMVNMGCQGFSTHDNNSTETPHLSTLQPESPTRAISILDRFNPSSTRPPERVPQTEAHPSVTGEVPDKLLSAIMADLAGRTGIASDNIFIVQAQASTWNDGSMGCPQPGILYTQALVNGYWVVLEANGEQYDYRASSSGYFFLCENGLPPIPPQSTPDS